MSEMDTLQQVTTDTDLFEMMSRQGFTPGDEWQVPNFDNNPPPQEVFEFLRMQLKLISEDFDSSHRRSLDCPTILQALEFLKQQKVRIPQGIASLRYTAQTYQGIALEA